MCQFGSTFGFFRYRRREYLEVLLVFLSLRYGADLGRSRLVRQTTDLIVYVPLFTDFTRSRVVVSTVFTQFTVNPVITGSSPCFSQKLFQAIFFRHCATFSIFFCLQKVPPSSFFDILQQLKCQKAQRVSPFMHFGTMRLFKIFIFRFFSKIEKNRNFFVSKGPPFN